MTSPELHITALDKQGLPVYFEGDKKKTVVILGQSLLFMTKRRGAIIVPAGFVSDGCSIPRALWTALGHPFSYKYLREAILHDYLYLYQPFSRRTADKIFRDELKKGGNVGLIRRNCIYRALRLFGGIAWKNNQKKMIDKIKGEAK